MKGAEALEQGKSLRHVSLLHLFARQVYPVVLGEMVVERLQYSTLTLHFLLQLIQMLGEQIPNRTRGLELLVQHSLCREDA